MYTHGITFGGHPVQAAIALKNIEIMKRERIVEHVRDERGALPRRRSSQLLELPIVGDLRGAGYFWALELVKDKETRRASRDEESRDAAARLPLAAAVRARADLPRRRPRRPGHPDLAAADRRAGRVRRDGRHPRRRARGGLGEDRLTLAPGEATPWWLEEAVGAGRAGGAGARGDVDADVVIVGGGYTGMWTALALTEREPDCASSCSRPTSAGTGRAGATAASSTAVDVPAALRERFGDEGALAVARAGETIVPGIGAWCEAGRRRLAPRGRDDARLDDPRTSVTTRSTPRAAGRPDEVVPLDGRRARARCDSPRFRRASSCPTTRRCSRRGSRSGCGGGARRGSSVHERTRGDGHPAGRGRDGAGPRAGAGASSRSTRPRRRAPAARAWSRPRIIVLTEPVPSSSSGSTGPAARRSPTGACSCTTSARRTTDAC